MTRILIICLAWLLFPACSADKSKETNEDQDSHIVDSEGIQNDASGEDSPNDTSTQTTYLEPPAESEGFQFFMKTTVPAFSEVWRCEVYPMPVDTAASVSWVEFKQTPGMHHMTLSAPGLEGGGKIPYGTYECDELYESIMEDMIMFFGSQADEDVMHLPDGVAANFPAGLDVVHEVHYVNVTDKPVEAYSYVNAYTIPKEEVVNGIWGGQVRDENIEIPANSDHTEWTRCVMNEDVDVHFLASHTHELGTHFSIRHFDGETAGEPFYENNDWHDPMIVQYNPPMILKKGSGFEYSCSWNNPHDYPISYGLTSKDEMCNLAIVHTPQSITAKCKVVETSDGVLWD